MKFLTHQQFDHDRAGRWVWRDGNAAEDLSPDGPDFSNFQQAPSSESVGGTSTRTANDSSSNLALFNPKFKPAANDDQIIDGRIESGSGAMHAETADSIDEQVEQTRDQVTDATIQKALSGSKKARRMTPERFDKLLKFDIYSPRFWLGRVTFNPKQIVLEQAKEAIHGVGDPAKLVEGSALLSDRGMAALMNNDVMNKAIRMVEQSGANKDINNVSLTSLETLKSVFEIRNQRFKKITAEQVQDFTEVLDEAVFWKKWIRKPLLQEKLYKVKLSQMQKRNQAGHEENMAILEGVIQTKEQNVFSARQSVDETFIRAENAGPNLIPELGITGLTLGDYARRTIHHILNHPDVFVRSPQAFQEKVPLSVLFGEDFVPLDILEALKTSKYEKFRCEKINYLNSAINVEQWQMSHYNAIRTIGGVKERKQAIDQFGNTSFEKIEKAVNKIYEPGKSNINLENPAEMVARVKWALESAAPDLRKDVNTIIKGHIFSGYTEQFWFITKYFNDHPVHFKSLPLDVQQDFAAFFLNKRSTLEGALVSGSRKEEASVLWRGQAMARGKDVLDKVKIVADLLPTIGSKLLSREKGVAQKVLQDLKGLPEAYKFFIDLVGDPKKPETKNLLSKLPELEQDLLENVFLMSDFVESITQSRDSLAKKRDDFLAILDVDPDLVTRQVARMEEFQKSLPDVKSGLDDINAPLMGMGFTDQTGGTGDDTQMGGAAGGGIEPLFKTIQREVDQLRSTLQGPADSTDGGQIGQAEKIINFAYTDLPGNIKKSLLDTANLGDKLLEQRLNIIGVEDIEALLKSRPTFDDLARMDLWDRASKDIIETASTFIQNDVTQQYNRMKVKEGRFIALEDLYYMDATFQSKLTVEGIADFKKFKDAQYVRAEKDGAIWYHTAEESIKIYPPSIGSHDERNILIWEKTAEEKGLKNFVVPYGDPDRMGILLSSNPENSASKDNPLYGGIAKNIKAANDKFAFSQD